MVDLQNDFCEGGSLAVPFADEIIPLANQLQAYFDIVIATKDWHPKDHMSFASNHAGKAVFDIVTVNGLDQILWPDHCIQESYGSQFHPGLDTSRITKIIYKGTDKNIDSYSTFFDNAHLRETGLKDFLRREGIQDIYIMGLATDYCVKYSCRDAVKLGFNTHIIEDACRGVGLNADDINNAMTEMVKEGVKITHSQKIIS